MSYYSFKKVLKKEILDTIQSRIQTATSPDADASNTFKDTWYTNLKQGGAGQNCPDHQKLF